MCSKRCVTHSLLSSLWFHICHTVSYLPTSSLILASSRDSSLSFTMALSLWNANTWSSEHLRAAPMDLKCLQYSNPEVQLTHTHTHTHTHTGPGVCNSLSTQCMREAVFWLQTQQDLFSDTARHWATGLHFRGTRETQRGGKDCLTWKVGRYTCIKALLTTRMSLQHVCLKCSFKCSIAKPDLWLWVCLYLVHLITALLEHVQPDC